MPDLLRISIITPCLDRVSTVESSIQSVLRQGYSNVEHIIMDGGSTDGTAEILARYPHLKVVSEKDNGMYDALNKGLDMATGEIVGFLNADDIYADYSFSRVMQCFNDEKIDVVSGKAQVFEETEGISKTLLELPPPAADKLVETAITGSTIFNAWFYRKSIIQQAGGFDSRYRISGDADLILRLALKKIGYLPLESVHYFYRQHEDSLTFQPNSEKLLKAFKDHSLFIGKYIFSTKVPKDVRALFKVLYANTCLALASQYLKEGKRVQSLLWRVRATLDISIPVFKYILFDYMLDKRWTILS